MARVHHVSSIVIAALLLWGASDSSHAGILFPRGTAVPPSVQAFAWRIVQARCNFLAFEREQRSFWAYDTRAGTVSAEPVYWIRVLSERPWRKSEPPATIDMTVAVRDGQMRLASLSSTFVVCR
jgi:hypothetical protein